MSSCESTRRTLSASDRIVVRAIAEAMFSEDGEVSDSALDAHVRDVDAYVSAASKPIGWGLRVALFVVSISPLLMFFRRRRLAHLSIPERVTVLSRLERSAFAPLSLAFIGWRAVMTLVFYEDPAELSKIGYTGEERLRYKRHLATLPIVAAVPAPEESGVRLRDSEADLANRAASDTNGSREVA